MAACLEMKVLRHETSPTEHAGTGPPWKVDRGHARGHEGDAGSPDLALLQLLPKGAIMQVHLNPGTHALGQPVGGYAVFGVGSEAGCGAATAALQPRDPLRDGDFVALQRAYRPSGGLAHGDELATRLHVDGAGGYARLARWIVGRQVFSFAWHEHFWLPMFQFEPRELTPRPGLHHVLAELADVMDGQALADWFALPNDLLHGHSPAEMWGSHGPAVQHAARMQRSLVTA